MKVFVTIVALLISCWADVPCRHTNVANKSEEQVINEVVAHADHNNDGFITDLDVVEYFVFHFDHNHNNEVDRNEFVNQWHKMYHDDKPFAGELFDHLDTNDDGKLNLDDVTALIIRVDVSGDGQVTVAEFKSYLDSIYNAC